VNWRDLVKNGILGNPHAKHAKAHQEQTLHDLLQLLHTEHKTDESKIAAPTMGGQPSPAGHNHQAEVGRATALLNQSFVRIMRLDGVFTVGVWSDLDGANIRAALRTLDMDHLPVRYLDGAGIPLRYKLRRVEGEPVPMRVLAEMERHSAELWKARGPSAESRPLSGFGKSPS
jgi:hypothetical protein